MGGHPGRIPREHPGKHLTPYEPSRERISPQQGCHGPLGLGPTPGGLPSSAGGGLPSSAGDGAVFIGTVPFGSHGHPKGQGIDKLSVPGSPGPDGTPLT